MKPGTYYLSEIADIIVWWDGLLKVQEDREDYPQQGNQISSINQHQHGTLSPKKELICFQNKGTKQWWAPHHLHQAHGSCVTIPQNSAFCRLEEESFHQ